MSASGGGGGGGQVEDKKSMDQLANLNPMDQLAHLNPMDLNFEFEIMDRENFWGGYIFAPSGPGQPAVWRPRDERRYQMSIDAVAEQYLIDTVAGKTYCSKYYSPEAKFSLVAEYARMQMNNWDKVAALFHEGPIDDQVAEGDLGEAIDPVFGIEESDFPPEGDLGEAIDPTFGIND